MRYLLDVNVLIAAIWRDHSNHRRADAWTHGRAMAVCPIVELGFLRISTHPKGLCSAMPGARRLLQDFICQHDVEFVGCDMAALESKAGSSDEVTDQYLAELAARNGMKLATLDRVINHPAVEII
ncbi:MAG: hypothetical protein JNK85_24590 [Verrucomicrobiales bacterium]|nr:hypothetical protein [Verrucomicrobiales bacterium]